MRAIRCGEKTRHRKFYIAAAALSAAANPTGEDSSSALLSAEATPECSPPEQAFAKYAAEVRAKKLEDLTEGDKLALKRLGSMKWDELSERVLKDRQFFQQFDHVKSEASGLAQGQASASASASASSLVVRVHKEGQGSHNQRMFFDPEELAAVRTWLLGIDEEHMRQAMPGRQAEELIALRMLSPDDYVREALTKIANANDTIRQWLFKSADQHHPLWNSDGTLKRELLPEGWTTIYFKGSGEAPILKEDVHLADRLQDYYFWAKLEEAHPLDRRCMGAEYDIRRNPNGWIFDMIARKLKAVRPVDLDKDYYFELEADKPFHSAKAVQFDQAQLDRLNSKFAVKDPVIGKILGAVPSYKNGPLPAMDRMRIMDLAFKAKTTKTYVELAAGEGRDDKNDAVKQPMK